MAKQPGRSGFWIIAACTFLQAGCRCCCLLDPYATAIDHLKDYPVVFDTWYHPRLDISRAGKPDWCGPINSCVAPCRCDCVSECSRFDPIWQYPPRHPYLYPGSAYPGASQFEDAEKQQAPTEPLLDEELPPGSLPPAPVPEE